MILLCQQVRPQSCVSASSVIFNKLYFYLQEFEEKTMGALVLLFSRSYQSRWGRYWGANHVELAEMETTNAIFNQLLAIGIMKSYQAKNQILKTRSF